MAENAARSFLVGFDAAYRGLAPLAEMWKDRAERIAFEEDKQGIDAQIDELGQPIRDAQDALKEARVKGDEKAMLSAASQFIMANAEYGREVMELAASMGASTNRYAQRAAESYQNMAIQAVQQGMAAAKGLSEASAQAYGMEQQKLDRQLEDQRFQLEERRFESQEGFQEQKLGLEEERVDLQREGLREERAARQGAAGREQQRIDLESERLEIQRTQAEAESQRFDRQQLMQAVEMAGELRATGWSEEAIQKLTAKASGGLLDLKDIEDQAIQVREQDEMRLKELQADQKILAEAGEDTSFIDQQIQELQQARVNDALRRNQRRKKGLSAEPGIGESFADLISKLAPMGEGMTPREVAQ